MRRNVLWGLVFTSPAITGLLWFTGYPVLGNTLCIVLWSVPLGIVVALGLALLLNLGVGGRSVHRTVFHLPTIVPAVASGVLWMYVFDPQYGLLNDALAKIGVTGPGRLSEPAWAKPALIVMSAWGVGNLMVILLAGLQDVPVTLRERAASDGAGWLSRFRHVTLPYVSPHLLFALVTGLIGGFQFFTPVFVMTGGTGSPAGSTLVSGLYLYQNAFPYFKVGYASAIAWVLFAIVAAITVATFRLAGRRVYYGGR